jgi:hypothetical protein
VLWDTLYIDGHRAGSPPPFYFWLTPYPVASWILRKFVVKTKIKADFAPPPPGPPKFDLTAMYTGTEMKWKTNLGPILRAGTGSVYVGQWQNGNGIVIFGTRHSLETKMDF